MNLILNIDKPAGLSSFGVIREVKKLTGEKKIGHLGTLDPLAKGVLPLFLGKMTKLVGYLNQGDKSYQVEATLGLSSTTGDEEGEKQTHPIPASVTEERIREVLAGFVGPMEQTPPMYSAVKVGGKPLYKLAREGKEIERKSRLITLYAIEDIEVELPKVRFHVSCSKGTYIRVLVEDLGRALESAAYMSDLVRTSCEGGFSLDSAVSLDQLRKMDHSNLLQLGVDPLALFSAHSVMVADERQAKLLANGQAICAPIPASFERFNRDNRGCLVIDRQRNLLAIGYLEFSQDSPNFKPEKILV